MEYVEFPLIEDLEARACLAEWMFAVSQDHYDYIDDCVRPGMGMNVKALRSQGKAPKDLAKALVSDAATARLNARWAPWVAEQLEQYARDMDRDNDCFERDAALRQLVNMLAHTKRI